MVRSLPKNFTTDNRILKYDVKEYILKLKIKQLHILTDILFESTTAYQYFFTKIIILNSLKH